MKVIDLSDYRLKSGDEKALSSGDELQKFKEGQYVEHREGGPGVIAASFTEKTSWFPKANDDDSEVEIPASNDNPVYVVALLSGGSIPAEASDLKPIENLPGEGAEPDLSKAAKETELAEVYSLMDDPFSLEELEEAKRKIIHRKYLTELTAVVESGEMSLKDLAECSYEELLNIPGVDDPEVGFASDPNGWTRKSYLQAWATVGATWRSCRARMVRHFGNRMAKRWCAALKDEVLGTERWRNRF